MKKNIGVLLMVNVAFVCFSCSPFFSDEGTVRRGKLSEAMEKSSDDYKGERKVKDSKKEKPRPMWEEDDDYYRERDRYPKYPDAVADTNPPARGPVSLPDSAADTLDTLLAQCKDSTGAIDLEKLIDTYHTTLTVTGNRVDRLVLVPKDSAGTEFRYRLTPVPDSADDSKKTRPCAAPADDRPGSPPFSRPASKNYIGVRFSSGIMRARHYSAVSGGSLFIAGHTAPKSRHALAADVSFIPMTASSDLFGSIGDIVQLGLGYQFRRYTTPDFTFMGIFFSYGFDIKSIFWDYKNPVSSKVYDENNNYLTTETIYNDGLWGFSPNAGFGVSLIQTSGFRVSAETNAGGSLYWMETHRKFENDIFNRDLFIRATVEVALRAQWHP